MLDAVDAAPKDRSRPRSDRVVPYRFSMMAYHREPRRCYWRLAGFRRLKFGLKRGSTGLAYRRGVSNFLLLGAPVSERRISCFQKPVPVRISRKCAHRRSMPRSVRSSHRQDRSLGSRRRNSRPSASSTLIQRAASPAGTPVARQVDENETRLPSARLAKMSSSRSQAGSPNRPAGRCRARRVRRRLSARAFRINSASSPDGHSLSSARPGLARSGAGGDGSGDRSFRY